jgi:chromate reductase
MSAKILAFAGSARRDSFNRKLCAVAVAAARAAGGDVTHVELADFPLPLYDGDCETALGLPENAKKLKELFLSHDGLLFACPEFNSSFTPLWKNTIDWVSRPAPGEKPLACFEGKVAAICSASPGALGGLRGLVHVRSVLGNIGVLVIPTQAAVSRAHEAFADDGTLKDERQRGLLHKMAEELVRTTSKLRG